MTRSRTGQPKASNIARPRFKVSYGLLAAALTSVGWEMNSMKK